MSVTISILDVNDNKPLFAKEIFNITMNENLPGDTQVITLVDQKPMSSFALRLISLYLI